MTIQEYVEARGYQATRLFNTIAAAEGEPVKLMGYQLNGPRGNKTFIETDNLEAARLWCDGVDYATGRLKGASRVRAIEAKIAATLLEQLDEELATLTPSDNYQTAEIFHPDFQIVEASK